ncbi:hypothetical protein NEHOM01_1400 [Nematocida homosporus]|uniref:uncharacterized protein n=1 Tax=Nematocida homosporus TaxID=1912981 RepID=UPI00221F5C5A|nr:uncharacterized protein NEHOM01_1400 [Nematocida homosporus]KAI5186336.1 hypothetical protein NEHOM01_1400 [Nematocida homosporus]
MGEEHESYSFELMDILRYKAPDTFPEGTSQDVIAAMAEYTPSHLLDIYLLAGDVPVCALLHPRLYSRIFKGWLRIGNVVGIAESIEDMIIDLELLSDIDPSEEDRLIKAKREIYLTMPSPLYHPRGHYIPLLSDDELIEWDRRWKKYLEDYTETIEDQIINPSDIDVEPAAESEQELWQKKRRVKERLGYTKTKNNVMKGRVLLKSKLFTFQTKKPTIPIFFSFILGTAHGLTKVYVWESAARKYFCLQEGDSVAIRGFKVKRRQGTLLLADRTNSDADTKYARIPEISVNLADPAGYILEVPESQLEDCTVELDQEFTQIKGTVEYVSSLLRTPDKNRGEKKLREFIYLRVAGQIIKLFSNGVSGSLLKIRAGNYVDIRHLRQCTIGPFIFYLSSIYTQYYLTEYAFHTTDYYSLTRPSTGTAIENAIGYLPVPFKTTEEYFQAAEDGLGPLYRQGVAIPKSSPDAAYLRKERDMYFGDIISVSAVKRKVELLYMDEVVRLVVPGRILGVRHQNSGDQIGETLFDISYSATECTLPEIEHSRSSINPEPTTETSFIETVEESAFLRIGDEMNYLDIQIFQNHLLDSTSFLGTVTAFFKSERTSLSVYEEINQKVGMYFHFVLDIVRISDKTVVYIGVAALTQ